MYRLILQLLVILALASSIAAIPTTTSSLSSPSEESPATTLDRPLRLLAVHVSSTSGETPRESIPDIQEALFTGPVTVAQQFRSISHNQLLLEPATAAQDDASSTTTNGVIEHGVMSVTIDTKIKDSEYYSITPAIVDAVEARIHDTIESVADWVMICLPTGGLARGVAGKGQVGGNYTWYHAGTCAQLEIVMHELGHNLGFRHSGWGPDREYGDDSGYMGVMWPVGLRYMGRFLFKWMQYKLLRNPMVTVSLNYPRKAFNAHKHWQSGWFDDRTITIDPKVGGLQRLVSFVDYEHSEMKKTDVVLIRVGDIFLQYNRAKGYNIEAPQADRVVIVKESIKQASTGVASLAQGQSSIIVDPNGNSFEIQVCTLIKAESGSMDYGDISIHPKGRNSFCPQGTGRSIPSGLTIERIDEATHSTDHIIQVVGGALCCCVAMLLCLCLVLSWKNVVVGPACWILHNIVERNSSLPSNDVSLGTDDSIILESEPTTHKTERLEV